MSEFCNLQVRMTMPEKMAFEGAAKASAELLSAWGRDWLRRPAREELHGLHVPFIEEIRSPRG
jgi:hypothetical protein